MKQLKGKVAIVTGASKGIGAGIAKKFALDGAKVVLNYASDKAGAEKTAAEIEKSGGQAFIVKADVSKENEAQALVHETVKRFGKLDTLVNNAGVFRFTPFTELDDKYFDWDDEDQCPGSSVDDQGRSPAFLEVWLERR